MQVRYVIPFAIQILLFSHQANRQNGKCPEIEAYAASLQSKGERRHDIFLRVMATSCCSRSEPQLRVGKQFASTCVSCTVEWPHKPKMQDDPEVRRPGPGMCLVFGIYEPQMAPNSLGITQDNNIVVSLQRAKPQNPKPCSSFHVLIHYPNILPPYNLQYYTPFQKKMKNVRHPLDLGNNSRSC